MKLNLTIERYSGPNIGFSLGNFLELTLNISHVINLKLNNNYNKYNNVNLFSYFCGPQFTFCFSLNF